MIALFDLSGSVRYGGFVTFAVHFYRGLIDAGYQPILLRPAKTNETKARIYAGGITYRNMQLDNLVSYAKKGVILATHWKQTRLEALALLEAGAGLFLHDPTEYAKNTELLDWLGAHPQTRIWVIREANKANLAALGIDATLILHPYQRFNIKTIPANQREHHALSLSRIDYDKHTDIIIEANHLLPLDKQVEIFGFEQRRYTHLKLETIYPDWRQYYCGAFPREWGVAVKLAAQRRFLVDMSIIQYDGGGTQYTFLEAWDAGCTLVLNSAWKRAGDELTDDLAYFVNDPEGLAEVLDRSEIKQGTEAVQSVFERHDACRVAIQFMEHFNLTP